jgi:hypothetical protein
MSDLAENKTLKLERNWDGIHNTKLACLSLANLSSLVYSFWVRPGSYRRVEHLKVLYSGRLWTDFKL